jgi:hypothetical protein
MVLIALLCLKHPFDSESSDDHEIYARLAETLIMHMLILLLEQRSKAHFAATNELLTSLLV